MKNLNKHNYYLNIAEAVAPRNRKNCSDIGKCMRNEMGIPRGERYELCRSVHAEANAIISASRQEMIGSTLYLTGIDVDSQDYVQNSCSCSMCKRLIINAGIKDVVIRDSKEKYRIIPVQEWIDNDESLNGKLGY